MSLARNRPVNACNNIAEGDMCNLKTAFLQSFPIFLSVYQHGILAIKALSNVTQSAFQKKPAQSTD